MKEKEKLRTGDEILEKKLLKKGKAVSFAKICLILPILGVSLFQTSYYQLNSYSKNIISDSQFNKAKYLLSDNFNQDYLYDHFSKNDYSDQQYKQDLKTYDDYNDHLKEFYNDNIKTDVRLLSLFPKLKDENFFLNLIYQDKSTISYFLFNSYYRYKNTNIKIKSQNNYRYFYYQIYDIIAINYNNQKLNNDQEKFISEKNIEKSNFLKKAMLRDNFIIDIISKISSPESPEYNILYPRKNLDKMSKFNNVNSYQNDVRYIGEMTYNEYMFEINGKSKNIEQEKKNILNKIKDSPTMRFNELSKDKQAQYIEILNKAVDIHDKYQDNYSELNSKLDDLYYNTPGVNFSQVEKSDPVEFKNTLKGIRYGNDISNIKYKTFMADNNKNNYKDVNFYVINKLNRYFSLSFLSKKDAHQYSNLNGGYFSDKNNDDQLRLKLSGFYQDQDLQIKENKDGGDNKAYFNSYTYFISNN